MTKLKRRAVLDHYRPVVFDCKDCGERGTRHIWLEHPKAPTPPGRCPRCWARI